MIRGFLTTLLCSANLVAAQEVPKPAAPATKVVATAPRPAPPLGSLVDTLDQAALQEAFRLLTNNPRKVVGLEAYDLQIVEQLPIRSVANPHNARYLETKKKKMGHKL